VPPEGDGIGGGVVQAMKASAKQEISMSRNDCLAMVFLTPLAAQVILRLQAALTGSVRSF
jgi:hypothetical protein